MAKVAVVILNYNGVNFLEKFLPSVLANCPQYAEVIVADNASTDQSIIFLEENYPTLKIIKNQTNGGFAEGYNLALAQVEAEYFVLLNSDIEVTPNWIEPIIELMDSNKTIAACQPKILAYAEKTKFEYAGGAGGFIDRWGYAFCRGRVFDFIEEDNGQYNDTIECFWASGACLFVRANLYNQVGGLDAKFFAHQEEIDLCWRLKNMGYKIMACGNSSVYHVGGGTLAMGSPFKTYLNFRNSLYLLFKNLPIAKLLPVLLVRMVLDGIAAIRFALLGQGSHFWAVFRAHIAFYTSLGWLVARRKALKPLVKGYKHKQVVNLSIVYRFFINKQNTFTAIVKN